jgi:hypothetical protein
VPGEVWYTERRPSAIDVDLIVICGDSQQTSKTLVRSAMSTLDDIVEKGLAALLSQTMKIVSILLHALALTKAYSGFGTRNICLANKLTSFSLNCLSIFKKP